MKTDDKDPQVYDFGWWPEIAGALSVIALIALMIGLATGIM
ncbi:hypothetical protein ACT3RP_16160 [Halomonas sp. AOP5-B2-8]